LRAPHSTTTISRRRPPAQSVPGVLRAEVIRLAAIQHQ
jgi:hypothetical protein